MEILKVEMIELRMKNMEHLQSLQDERERYTWVNSRLQESKRDAGLQLLSENICLKAENRRMRKQLEISEIKARLTYNNEDHAETICNSHESALLKIDLISK